MTEGRLQKTLMKLMENDGGKNDKWMIMKTDDKMIIWTNVIFKKKIVFIIFLLAKPHGG